MFYDFSFIQWALLFYIYAFAGWIFECIVVSVQQKRLVNRGFLRGPMLPIYGFGAILMLHTALPLHGHLIQIFFAGMVVATFFEYIVGIIMEAIFHVKYWDYSEHKFQFQGRICLQSSIAWGVLSVLLVTVFQPPINFLLSEFNSLPLIFTVSVLTVYFVTDVVASIKTAIDLGKTLEEMDKVRRDVQDMRQQLALAADKKKDELTQFAHQGKEQLENSAEAMRLQLKQAIEAAEQRMDENVRKMHMLRKSMIKGNPTLRSTKFNDTLDDLRERLKNMR